MSKRTTGKFKKRKNDAYFTPESAVLDTWATSALTPLINSKWNTEEDMTKKLLPMGMRTQAHEIIRTWAFYSIVRSVSLPISTVIVTIFLLNANNETNEFLFLQSGIPAAVSLAVFAQGYEFKLFEITGMIILTSLLSFIILVVIFFISKIIF